MCRDELVSRAFTLGADINSKPVRATDRRNNSHQVHRFIAAERAYHRRGHERPLPVWTPCPLRRAPAQQSAVPVVGLLGSASPAFYEDRLRAFRQGLSETGFDEGRNVIIEYRWSGSRNDQLPALAADLVRQQVAAMVALGNTASALAAKAATSSIPIVFRIAANPVEAGLVASLAHPGGNLTGVTTLGVEAGPKQLELLSELIPAASVVGLLVNP
jgi:putative tryptophan/tyrosine transport system substrate-binding protein